MPVRTISSTGTARGTTTIPKKAASTQVEGKGRPISNKLAQGKNVGNPSDNGKSSKGVASRAKEEAIIDAIKIPTSCNTAVVEGLASLLGMPTFKSDCILSIASSSKTKVTSTGVSAPLQAKRNGFIESPFTELSDVKRIHLAKLVVNAVIASLNDLIGLGWKMETSDEKSLESQFSGHMSASTTSKTSSATSSSTCSRSIKVSKVLPRTATVTELNVTSIFECAPLAVQFLRSAAAKGSLSNMKELELDFILISIIRKVVAMDMHRLASSQLELLKGEIVSKYTEEIAGHDIEFPTPNTIISSRLCDLILEAQALSLTCALFQTRPKEVNDLFAAITQPLGGPLSWQHYVRSTGIAEECKESADRHAYSVERSMTKYLAKYSKSSEAIDADVVLQCRKVSLDFLLFVSDLDQDAFWDRTARVGSSYMKSKTNIDDASTDKKKLNFAKVDDMFRDVVRRMEQLPIDGRGSNDDGQRLQGKGFSRFCQVWLQLASRAGEAQALHHVAGLLARNSDIIQTLPTLSEDQIDSLLLQTSIKLTQSVVALEEMLEGETMIEGAIKTAEVEVDAALGLIGMANTDGLQKMFKVLDQLRRRCMRLLDEKRCKVEEVTDLLLAICKHHEEYLKGECKGQAVDDEAILEDCIYVLRSLANAVFDISDWKSHEVAATYLCRCEALVKSQEQERRKHFSNVVWCNKMRLLSSSWYHIGGQLYNDKKLPLAIRFLKSACESAQMSMQLFTLLTNEEKEKVKKPDGIAKKWEHLAVSYRYTSQSQLAYEAFLTALLSIEQEHWRIIEQRAAKVKVSEVFVNFKDENQGKNINDVASIAKACFEVATFDLLLYTKEEEKDWSAHLLDAGISQEIVAVLLEHCLLSLDNVMHREEAPKAAYLLLEKIVGLYDEAAMPIRRSRALLRRMELAVMQPNLFTSDADRQAILAISSKEVQRLLNQSKYSQDDQLVTLVPQYMAMLPLFMVLQEQQRAIPFSQSQIEQYASEAIARLAKMIPSSFSHPVPKRTLKTSSAPKQQQQQSTHTNPITPPSRGKKSTKLTSHAQGAAIEESASSSNYYDGALRLCLLIELVYEVLSSCGHLLASMKLLQVSKQLAFGMVDRIGFDVYLGFSASLTRQYIHLGSTTRAGQLVTEMAEIVKGQEVSQDTKVRCLFVMADYYCSTGQVSKSEEVYHDAIAIASQMQSQGRPGSVQNAVNRCLASERQAFAAETISTISYLKGDAIGPIKYSILGVRSAMKAGLVLSRLTAAMTDVKGQIGDTQSPFRQVEEIDLNSELTKVEKNKPLPRLNSWSIAILYWRLIKLLYSSYMRVSRLYKSRGSARDAEAFVGEAIDLVSGLCTPLLSAGALVERGHIRIQSDALEKGIVDLDQAVELIDEGISSALVNIQMAVARAEVDMKSSSFHTALGFYGKAEMILSELIDQYHQLDSRVPPSPPSKSRRAVQAIKQSDQGVNVVILSDIKGKLLQKKAWILHLLERNEESRGAMDEAASLLQQNTDRGINCVIQGKIQVHQSCRVLKANHHLDQILGMFPESASTMPMSKSDPSKDGCNSKVLARSSAVNKMAASHLTLAQSLLESVTRKSTAVCIDSIGLREACLNLAISQKQLYILKGQERTRAADVVALLENISAIALQRELMEAIDTKLETKSALSSIPGWQLSSKEQTSRVKEGSIECFGENESQNDDMMRQEWTRIQLQYMQPTIQLNKLPENWTVVSINLYRERNCLVLTSRDGGTATRPIVFNLPLDRQSRREGEEEEIMGVDDVLQEIKDIVAESNTATHAAQHLDGMQARKDWWSKRRELDNRMKELLGNIEVTWLGAFKSLFLPRPSASEEDFRTLRLSFDAILQRAFFSSTSTSSGSKRTNQVGLDDCIFETFSSLAFINCTDEELEDLIHFVMDVYQFQGIPIAVDEVDLDLCVTEVRNLLEGFRTKHPQVSDLENDHHIFLILDKDTCVIPWESIPVLRKQAVCRIPSIGFLNDRLEKTKEQGIPGRFCIASKKAKLWYLVNPSKDLTRTQDRFLPWLQSSQKSWTGISNRAPILEEMAEALEKNDIVLYFGHGGGEQYIRPSRLRSLNKCAVTMLWGCSSGLLKNLGDFDRTGTPYNYLMAGCPSLLGNLWDATDKELDGLSESVLEKMGLKERSNDGDDDAGGGGGGGGVTGEFKRLSIAQAVAQSRDACKLPYLTGATCVVYGVPVYYQ